MANQTKIKINYYINRAAMVFGEIANVQIHYDINHEPKVEFDAKNIHFTVNEVPYQKTNHGFRIQASNGIQTVIDYELNYLIGLRMTMNHLKQLI